MIRMPFKPGEGPEGSGFLPAGDGPGRAAPRAAGSQVLTSRVTLINVVATGVAVLLASVILIGVEYLTLRDNLQRDLQVQAHIVGENEASPLVFGDAAAAQGILQSLEASPAILAAEVLTVEGRVLASYRRRDSGPAWQADVRGLLPRFIDIAQDIALDGERVGSIRLRATLLPLYGRLLAYAGTTLAVALGAMLAAFLAVAKMRRRVGEAERRLHFLAHTDPVTRLPNRHSFNEQLAFAVEGSKRFHSRLALLLVDLDNFKLVNDTFGHQVGDALLAAVARRIRAVLRQSDVVCRMGGDEFGVMLDRLEATGDAGHIAEKLLDALVAPFAVGEQEVFVCASIGISFCPQDTDDPDDLIRNADTALYAAKARGKGTFEYFTPRMNEHTSRRLNLESSLRRALEREEFVLHYQPQIDIASGRVVGAEALVRWNSAERGMVSPADFIPLAEETGLIVPIGEWVLRTACIQAVEWQKAGLAPLRMAVNVSARQLDERALRPLVLAILRETGLAPRWLELEITESAVMSNAHVNAQLLRALSAEGVKLAIDDFGTGYSSMGYLRRFPIDTLKIDRSFVAELTTSADDRAIVRAVVAMSHSLGLRVLAEGVETQAQRAELQRLECDLVQGYLVSRPLPAEAFAAFLQAGAGATAAAPGAPASATAS